MGCHTFFPLRFDSFFQCSCSVFLVYLLQKVPVTFPHCFKGYTPLYWFLLSQWWPALIIIFFRLLHILVSLSKWNCLPTSFVCMSHKLHVKLSSLSINKPSVAILPLSFVWLSRKVPVTFFLCFLVSSPLYYYFLSHFLPILIITLYGMPHIFFVYFWFIF